MNDASDGDVDGDESSGIGSSITSDRPGRAIAASVLLAIVAAGCGDSRRAEHELASTDAPPERIILIVADTLRRDHLSPYGSALATPAVAALARRGQVFTNAVSSFHQTSMSMAAMFTGRTPSLETGDPARSLPWSSANWCGLARLGAGDGESCVPHALDTLAEDLRGAGYETLGIATNRFMFRPHGFAQGFDDWVELGEKELPQTRRRRARESLMRTGDKVNQAVFAMLMRRGTNRFFLYVHYMDPHEYAFRPGLETYEEGVSVFDRALGELLEHLESDGLLENAAIVLTSDHGEMLGSEHALAATKQHFGNPSFDPLLRVPLIVVPPTSVPSDRLLRSQDVRGLVRGIAGLEPGAPADLEADELFVTEQFFQTYRRGRFKSMWSRDGEKAALFDLLEDPGETRDVSDEHPDVVARHRQRIRALTTSLGTRRGEDAAQTAEDEERLRALGYVE